jgi:uncharacterized protein YqjF (DUF2071 family)
MSDFPTDAVLGHVSHRPWPMPDEPWIMTQSWHDLLFAHWPVASDALRELIPPGLELELFDQRAWLGIIPFHMSNVSPRGVPSLPWVSAFPELNVRTYVRAHDKPGIYFFSLDAGNPLAVMVARTLFHLPYFSAVMEVEHRDGYEYYASRRSEGDGTPLRRSGRPAAQFTGRYRPTGPAFTAKPGTLEYFLTERYCLYTLDPDFHLERLEIHHPPWALQPAEAEIRENTMAEASGIRLPSMAPTLHFSRRQDVVAFPLAKA